MRGAGRRAGGARPFTGAVAVLVGVFLLAAYLLELWGDALLLALGLLAASLFVLAGAQVFIFWRRWRVRATTEARRLAQSVTPPDDRPPLP